MAGVEDKADRWGWRVGADHIVNVNWFALAFVKVRLEAFRGFYTHKWCDMTCVLIESPECYVETRLKGQK